MTILVAMHLGSQTVLIADKYMFRQGQLADDKYVKVHQSDNHATVAGGCGQAMDWANRYLEGRAIVDEAELRGMSDGLIDELIKPFGKYFPGEITLMYVSTTINNQARLFTVIHDELKTGGRLKELTDHEPGEILFAIPRTLAGQPGDDFKREATAIFDDFMAGKGKDLKPHDAHSVASLAKSIGGALSKVAKETGTISKNYDVSVISSNGLIFKGDIDVDRVRKVNLMQINGQRITNDGLVCAM
ncbi:hypothetical protein [Pseudomonas sp. PLMAX]|uniref:hypothetical protein n=1 Tax=Pseudomonas sp. PLMAX TaxID=2201998 RepID=UPI0038BD574D